jgi:outer membrane protein insertion porin family
LFPHHRKRDACGVHRRIDKKGIIWYKDREMKKVALLLIFSCFPLLLMAQESIEKIEIVGNDRVARETIIYYLSSREGNPFSEEMLRRDFKTLWALGYFSNIKIEKLDGTNGKVVRITVEENPIIKSITYKTGKKIKESDIVDKLKEENEYILPYSHYDPYKIQKIRKTIQDLLFEKGLSNGKVEVKTNQKGQNDFELVFDINEGPRTKVGAVEFEGKSKMLPSALRAAMKQNKKHGLISWISGKDVYKENKLSEDVGAIKEKFKEFGYMEATVGEPRIEEIRRRSIFLRKKNMKKIVIPVDAGYLYRVGEVKIEGNKIIATKYLRHVIKFEQDEVYSTKVREKSVGDIKEMYADAGYLYAQVFPVESLDPKRKRVNVTFNVFEGEMVFLNRIDFKGNTYTKDKVLRRELLLKEGDPFRLFLFKNSILRLQQLGLVEMEGEPDLKNLPDNPSLMDVTLKVRELQRNNIQFTAGYSGYEGTFVGLSYSTVNFLGAGENLNLTVQHGRRIRNYMFGFTEPYFFDLPLNLGFNVHDRYIRYINLFDQRGKGADLIFGARVKGYLRTNLTYSYEYVEIEVPEGSTEEEQKQINLYNPYAAWAGKPYDISSISPTIYRSTVNSPITPTRGTLYLASCKFAGGFLGGDIDMIKPRLEWTLYNPLWLNHVLGFHIEYQFIKPYRDSEIPVWEKFFLGGERSIRGYNIYTIGPRDENGYNTGGEKSLVFNAEYIIPFGPQGPVYAILFYDMGNALDRNQKFALSNMFTSAGLELRIFVPALRVPFRLIFAYNNRRIRADDSNFAVRFAIGTTF